MSRKREKENNKLSKEHLSASYYSHTKKDVPPCNPPATRKAHCMELLVSIFLCICRKRIFKVVKGRMKRTLYGAAIGQASQALISGFSNHLRLSGTHGLLALVAAIAGASTPPHNKHSPFGYSHPSPPLDGKKGIMGGWSGCSAFRSICVVSCEQATGGQSASNNLPLPPVHKL